jgi:hypothetical protein
MPVQGSSTLPCQMKSAERRKKDSARHWNPTSKKPLEDKMKIKTTDDLLEMLKHGTGKFYVGCLEDAIAALEAEKATQSVEVVKKNLTTVHVPIAHWCNGCINSKCIAYATCMKDA